MLLLWFLMSYPENIDCSPFGECAGTATVFCDFGIGRESEYHLHPEAANTVSVGFTANPGI